MTSNETLIYANLTAASPYVKLSKLDSILTSLRRRREWVLIAFHEYKFLSTSSRYRPDFHQC
ncbi:hypothetical protein BCR33DRAFT_723711 [Rhizoclosmatium globosum]|uniref:Uncharacterized protein n=1 Tax=Rhizoclosmatium globosum TaxID=329046 RepID=A0A1Y2BBP8_9FUNG|nr:hypothetical protein BCR33DRAFT_723711 [Rhizoclosmatium globosum]|eukprot:ORY31907.1 hypothetical protein BCR33DRAFT_723711 [Rhizoclosmatium globosum]